MLLSLIMMDEAELVKMIVGSGWRTLVGAGGGAGVGVGVGPGVGV